MSPTSHPRNTLCESRAAIDVVPDEILEEIFTLYIDQCDFADSSTFNGCPLVSYKARAVLTGVCRRWSTAATNHARLWAIIQLNSHPLCFPTIPIVELWAQRSAARPIVIDMYGPWDIACGHPGDLCNPQHACTIMDVLRPHIHRWRSFKSLLQPSTAAQFSKLPLSSAKMLEELELVSPCDQDVDEQLFAAIAKIPALQRFTWLRYYDGYISVFEPAISILPWRQMTSIRLDCMMSIDEATQLFSTCTSAVAMRLQVRGRPNPRKISGLPASISIPSLRALELQGYKDVYELLQRLDLPNLEVFDLLTGMYSGLPTVPCVRFKEFLSRMRGLYFLKLHTFDFSPDEIRDFFNNPRFVDIPMVQFGIGGWGASNQRTAQQSLAKALVARQDITRKLQAYRVAYGLGTLILGWAHGDGRERSYDGMKFHLYTDLTYT